MRRSRRTFPHPTLPRHRDGPRTGGSVSVAQLRCYLGGEIGRRALDALAEGEAGKTLDPNRRSGGLAGLLDDPRDLGLLVDYEDLVEQHELFEELAQPPLDHSLDHRIGFAACLRLLAQHGAFAVKRRLRHRSDIEIERVRRGYMHG